MKKTLNKAPAVLLAGLFIAACAPEPEAPQNVVEPPKAAPVQVSQGFYRPKTESVLQEFTRGAYLPVMTLHAETCLRVIDDRGESTNALVELPVDAPAEDRMRGVVEKSTLREAPDCAAAAKEFSPLSVNPPPVTPHDGYTLKTTTFLYTTPDGKGARLGQLIAGDCVKIEEAIRPIDQMRLSALVRGRALSGWAYAPIIDRTAPCTLGL